MLPCCAPLSPRGPSSCVPARTLDASCAAGSWCPASGEPSPHGPLWAAGPAFQEPASQRLQPELGPGCARGVLVPRTGLLRTRSVNQGQQPGRPLHSLWGLSSSTGARAHVPVCGSACLLLPVPISLQDPPLVSQMLSGCSCCQVRPGSWHACFSSASCLPVWGTEIRLHPPSLEGGTSHGPQENSVSSPGGLPGGGHT